MKTVWTNLPFAVIHIGKSHKKPTHKPKLAKEYACPNARGDSAAKLIDNEINKNRQCLTSGIKHWGLSGYAKFLSRIKVWCILIVTCSAIPNCGNTQNVMRK